MSDEKDPDGSAPDGGVPDGEAPGEGPPGDEARNGGAQDGAAPGGEAKAEQSVKPGAGEEAGRPDGNGQEGDPDAALSAEDFRRRQAEVRAIRAASSGAGDAVGRDKIVMTVYASDHGHRWQVGVYTDDEEALARHRERFVGVSSRNALAAMLGERRLAVLRGASRTGRKTAALAALALFTERIRLVQGEWPPSRLTGEVVEPGCGYVFDATDALWARRPSAPALLGCLPLLESRSAWLVVLLPPDCDDTAVRDLVVGHVPPDPSTVLDRHLRADLRDEPGVAAEVLSGADPPATPADAADLARSVVRGRACGRSVTAVLESRPHPLRELARERLRQQRGVGLEQRDLARRAFLISWSVLYERPAVQICAAAQRLAERLHWISTSKTDTKLGQLPFGDVLDSWLGDVRREEAVPTAEVDRRLPVRKDFAEAVFHVVWFDYVVARTALLDWLTDLATDSDRRVRVLAALALGRLAAYDFDFIAQRCFGPWSRSSSSVLHEVTAWALEEVAKRERGRHREIFALADGWAGAASLARRSTAALLYGTELGTRDPGRAMRGLRRIARSDAKRLLRPVTLSVVEIFASGQGEAVVEALTDWAASPRPAVCWTAAGCLAELARLSDETDRPPLLALSDRRPDPVTELWRRVLTSRFCGSRPWDALRSWPERGVDIDDLRDRLERADERLRRPLLFYLGPRTRPGPHPPTAVKEKV
ncbi:hypothetical protein [Actinomadura kijaniata]|uniref:hypothetical protein n=1 Tax=Actinomadura kijaniata TaxID=46161 RepID=UPI00082B2B21|nr:hypothetical protein [Actinomadura kijaniata]